MPTTTLIGIPLPLAADNNDNVGAVTNLGNWLDPVVEGSYTQTEINAFTATQKWEHRRVFNSTRGCFQTYDLASTTWLDEQALNLNTQTISYTLVLADANSKLLKMNAAGAITLSIPTNASVAFPIGTVIAGFQYGAGQITVAAVTPGTTSLRGTPGFRTRAQYSAFTLTKIATDEWLMTGDIVA